MSGGYYEAGGSFLKLGLVEAFLVRPQLLRCVSSALSSSAAVRHPMPCRLVTGTARCCQAFSNSVSEPLYRPLPEATVVSCGPGAACVCAQVTMQAWSVNQFSAGFAKADNLENALDAIKWGADYLVNAHSAPNQFVAVVGNSTLDFNYYGGLCTASAATRSKGNRAS